MTASSPPMTTSRVGCLPAENLAPGHRHSQTAAVSSRRGDERTRAERRLISPVVASVGSPRSGRVLN
jgi:hypothetical protein